MTTNHLLNQLREVTETASSSETVQEGIAHLERAFVLFSEETARLEQAYLKLQKRFKAVNIELEKSHHELGEKVMQLDVITHYLNNILRHINQGILFIGLNGLITTYNSAAERILGLGHKSVIFQYFWDVFADDFFGFSLENAFKKLSSPELSYLTIEDKELEISTTFIKKGPTSNQGMILLIRDITEMRRLQKEGSRKSRMQELGEMAASVVHEIRSPLSGIQGVASLLYGDLENSPDLQEMASKIMEGSKSLNGLVENVLHYTQPFRLNKKSMDLALFIKKQMKNVQSTVSKKIKIDLAIKEDALLLNLDEALFKKAFLNLITNALEAMPQSGLLKVHLSLCKDKVFLVISDTGNGIEPKHLEKIFTPHFTTKKKGKGTSLSETYKIIEAHLGTIEVASEVGAGTTFKIIFPLRA